MPRQCGVVASVQPDRSACWFVSCVCADGQKPSISARLLNRMGQPMRTLEVRPSPDGDHEIDITLAGLPTGDYQLNWPPRLQPRREGTARLSSDELKTFYAYIPRIRVRSRPD